jgi:hypothetical protein
MNGIVYGERVDEMHNGELIVLRSVLALRRRGLVDRLATDTTGVLEPAFVSLLAETHGAIAAVDAALAESTIEGDER